jgi:hypothetical protein
MQVRTERIVVALVLVVGACTGGAEPSSPSADEAIPMLQSDGPLGAVVIATGVGPRGSIEPRPGYSTEDTQVTAFVSLSEETPTGSTMTVTWFGVSGPGQREELFSHRIDVEPGQLVFSEGIAARGLAPGLYETVARLGEWKVLTPWIVSRPVADDGNGRARHAVARSALGQSSLPDGEPPTAGESGVVPAPTPGSPSGDSTDRCTLGSIYAESAYDDVTVALFWGGPCTPVTLTASTAGATQTIASAQISDGIPTLNGTADICAPGLPGSSDLPGSVVHLLATGSGGVSKSLDFVLPDLGPELKAIFESRPERGSPVEIGDTITLEAMALLFDPALGVDVLKLYANDELFDSIGNRSNSDEPRACDFGRLGAWIRETRYEVPSDAPAIIEICAEGVGFDGTESRDCGEFYTGEVWKGAANITSSAVYPEGGVSCQDGWELDFTFGVSGEGTIEGQGTADLTSGPTCPFPIGPSLEHYEYRVLGEETEGGFSIRFALETFGPAGGAEYAGFVSMFGFPAPPSGGPPVSVAVSGTSGTGQGSWRFESGNPPATYSANGTITIECVASCEESAG